MDHLQQEVLSALEKIEKNLGSKELSTEDLRLLFIASLLEEASSAS